MIITLKNGDVTVALRPDLAPKHVEQIKKLVREKAYDNVAFHRVIDGFMAQTGDVQFGDLEDGYVAERAGTGGSTYPDLPAEFSNEPFSRGVLGMARAQDPNSANSQFLHLLRRRQLPQRPVHGGGTSDQGHGARRPDKKGDANDNGVVSGPDRMIKVRIAADGN